MRTHGLVSILATGLALAVTAPASAEPAPTQAGKSPLQVFILAGQSNMEGQGIIAGEKPGTLETLLKDPATAPRVKHLADASGKWVVRDDVWIWYLACLVRDLRKDLGVPKLPFVVAESGQGGPEEKHPRALALMKAQAAVAEYPEFKGTVAFVGTYFLIGDGMGKAMLGLLGKK